MTRPPRRCAYGTSILDHLLFRPDGGYALDALNALLYPPTEFHPMKKKPAAKNEIVNDAPAPAAPESHRLVGVQEDDAFQLREARAEIRAYELEEDRRERAHRFDLRWVRDDIAGQIASRRHQERVNDAERAALYGRIHELEAALEAAKKERRASWPSRKRARPRR